MLMIHPTIVNLSFVILEIMRTDSRSSSYSSEIYPNPSSRVGYSFQPQAVLFGCWKFGEWDSWGGRVYHTHQSRSKT